MLEMLPRNTFLYLKEQVSNVGRMSERAPFLHKDEALRSLRGLVQCPIDERVHLRRILRGLFHPQKSVNTGVFVIPAKFPGYGQLRK